MHAWWLKINKVERQLLITDEVMILNDGWLDKKFIDKEGENKE